MRVGIGYDVHAFTAGRPLVLGGVDVPHELGLIGHSDADVLAHALTDAVISAMRAGDLGEHFPDDDPAYAGARSIELLARVAGMMRDGGWRLVDADTVLVLERPRLSSYRDAMRTNLAEALGVEVEAVGVKATTTEGLGFAGREEGIAAYAVVLLERASG